MKPEEVYANYGSNAPIIPPLGLAYLASFLIKKKYDVMIFDGIVERKSLKAEIELFRPDVIGISSTTVSFHRAVETASKIKKDFPGTKIILGGNHMSSLPIDTIREFDCFDFGIYGEGENALADLLSELDKKNPNFSSIKNLVYRKGGNVKMNPPAEPIKDLDSLPFPAWDLLPDITKSYYQTQYKGERLPMAHLVPGRGCPFGCIYCDQNVFGRKWRGFSAKRVVDEIEFLVKKYGIKHVQFQEDLFICNKKRLDEFMSLLEERNLNITWLANARVNMVDFEMLKKMKKAGCTIIYFGIESGNQKVLDFIKKGFKLEDAAKAVRYARKAGIITHGSFILGLPTETKETIRDTINFAKSLDLDDVSFHIATPFPGTEFERIAENYGKLIKKDWSSYSTHSGESSFIPEGMTDEFLLQSQKKAYKEFYFRPKIILRKAKEVAKNPKTLKNYAKGLISVFK